MIMNLIQDRIAGLEGNMGISFINLESGQKFFCGNCDVFPASGTVKLMTLIACFKAFEEHKMERNSVHVLRKKEIVLPKGEPSYGILQFFEEGLKLTMIDLCRIMIVVADNQACNILIEKLGMEYINQTFNEFGYSNMCVNRKIFEYDMISKGKNNTISIKEMANILERMYKGQIVSPAASEEMLKLMEKHQRSNILPYLFNENARIAHQTGYDMDAIIDGGILYFDTPFVLSMAASQTDVRKAQAVMRDITQICYEETQRKRLAEFSYSNRKK